MNAVLLGLVAALSYGFHDFLARFPSRALGSTNTTFAVTAAGLGVLSLWLLLTGQPPQMSWPSLGLAALTGIFAALATLALFSALALGPVSIVAPIVGSFPAPALIFAMAMGARPSVADLLAIVAVLAGVALVSQSGERHLRQGAIKSETLKPMLALSLFASLAFAASFTCGQAAAPSLGAVEAAWFARIFALVTILLFYLKPAVKWRRPGRWAPLLCLMGGLDVLALTAIISAGQTPHAVMSTVVATSFSAITVLLARLILKELIVPIQLVGMILIVGGVGVIASA